MNERRTVKLGKEVDLLTGFPFESKKYSDNKDDIKLLRGDNIVQGSLRWDDVKRWPVDQQLNYQSFELQADDVVLAMDRPWIGAGLKFAAISKSDLPCLLVQRTARMRGGKNLDSRYLKYIIGSPWFSKYIQKITTGSLVPHISSRQIKDFACELPSLSEQQKIAGVLSAIDAKIELNSRINAELEAMAKILYDYWFVQFDFPFDFASCPEQRRREGKPDANGKPYKSSGGKMVYNSILKREIPEGWEANPLSKHLTCNTNKLGKKHDLTKICYLDTANLTRNVIGSFQNFICEEDDIPSRANMIVSKNDILYSTVRPNQYHYGIIKQPAENMIASTGFSVLSHKSNNLLNVVFYLCITNDTNTQRLIKISESSKSSYPSISPDDILNLVIAMPKNSKVVEKASNILNPIFDKVAEVQRETKELSALRDWLLPMLMNGQVTVQSSTE